MKLSKAVLTSIVVGGSLTLCAPAPATAAPGGERVVVLVPGQEPVPGQTMSRDLYAAMEQQLTEQGYTVRTVGVAGHDLPADSAVIGRAVEQATAGVDVESIALVAHSYGGLSSRNYLKSLGGSDVVDTYIAIGSPQYGTPGGCFQLPGSGFDGCPITPFMTNLNAGDDTPGDTKYVSIRSAEEWADGRLDGGQCRVTPIPNLAHVPEPADDRVIAAVTRTLSGECDAYVDEQIDSFTWTQTVFPQ
ncbi:triacylglycerol lipase [Antrihabitans sp. YC2-6]|uniref:esterase/lipase family protein n=1 Tax=Antrihabitans sp. YC2-6 TaxID=2799498 RepID=UPI0018F4D7A8|nr:lipase [Antrihabitans sp. YC2-6]MBJ8346383.1 lipase [Antrihabitans sp. YC2-6]